MKKFYFILLLTIIAGMVANPVSAQLSDRVNSPSTFKMGTRPVSGDMGVFVGISSDDVKNWAEFGDITGLPLINLKYYARDKFVLRLGIQATKSKSILEGNVYDPDPDNDTGDTISRANNSSVSETKLILGFEKHFQSSNLIDVYLGAGIPVGYNKEKFVDNFELDDGDYEEITRSKTSIIYGYNLFIGLQGFIADLPVAVGVEFGLSGEGHLNNKYKTKVDSDFGGNQTSLEVFTSDESDLIYDDLKAKDFELTGSVRVTLTYFFKR